MAVTARATVAPLDPSAYAVDGIVPQRVASPTTVGALARALREADAAGERVVIYGGGTLQGIGDAPRGYDLALSTARLNRVIAYEPRDLTIAVEAGISLEAVARRLARHRQFLPLDGPLPQRSTAGGLLASGWAGPRRASYGRPRDLVIGATAVLADGTVAASGGRVVKNVSGYDVAKLFSGSLGALGALARLNFKTLPTPELQRVAICRLPERSRERAVANLAELQAEPVAALHVWGFNSEIEGRDGIDGRLVLLFEGSSAAVDHATREMRSSLGAAGVPETALFDGNAAAIYQRVLDAYVAAIELRSASFRIFGLPSDLLNVLAQVHTEADRRQLKSESIADLRNGDVLVRVSAETPTAFSVGIVTFAEALYEACERVSLICAPPAVRSHVEGWNREPAAINTMRALKARFDPKGTLAPGRLAGGL
jgi:glycolate oxidase FAD binding subunit